MKNQNSNTSLQESQAQQVGIDECIRLSLTLIDADKKLTLDKKRSIIYSLFCFRCVFDDHLIQNPSPLFTQYNLVKGAVMPEKMDLYPLVHAIVSLPTCDNHLKALWYISFTYVLLLHAPHEENLYDDIYDLLCCPSVWDSVLATPYSIHLRDSVEELAAEADMPPRIIDWYSPYIAYKHQRDENGATREERKFLDWLAKGKFNDVFVGTEKLLDVLPDEDGILICNIAARISLENVVEQSAKLALLKETLALIESALERGSNKKLFLHYYAALAHIALQNNDAATANFSACLEIKPDFTPALNMLKALA